ncbi:hypothetical protein TcBrA4_0126250 [Trypanosoma cruzi]|nr:hypothetical protein TcBrA4_0126250 [Trypanosoma cruzi]
MWAAHEPEIRKEEDGARRLLEGTCCVLRGRVPRAFCGLNAPSPFGAWRVLVVLLGQVWCQPLFTIVGSGAVATESFELYVCSQRCCSTLWALRGRNASRIESTTIAHLTPVSAVQVTHAEHLRI